MRRDSAEASALPSATPTLHEVEPTRSEIDVSRAENEFNSFALELSEESRRERAESLKSGRSNKKHLSESDIEAAADDQPFDLREYLTSSNDKNQEAGIKHKHVGVTWEDLQVDVFGGINHKVRYRGGRSDGVLTSKSPAYSFMSEPLEVRTLFTITSFTLKLTRFS